MKTSIYLENKEVDDYIWDLGMSHEADLSTVFVRANHEFGLPHDDLAEAMYIAKKCGTDDKENVKSLLSKPYENMLIESYKKKEIGVEYLERWMTEDEIRVLDEEIEKSNVIGSVDALG